MKITGRIKVIFEDGMYTWEQHFALKVYFKEEGQIFNRTYERLLASPMFESDHSHEEFINKALQYLSNEEKLKEIAKDMVLKYYDRKENNIKAKSKETIIKDITKMLNKKQITFEMEIK